MKRALLVAALILSTVTLRAKASEVPQDIREAAEEIGGEYGVCPELIEAIAYKESRFTPGIKSEDGQYFGLLQVSPKWNKDRMARLGVTKDGLLTTRGNILVATDLLSELFETYEDVGDVLLAYGGFSEDKKRKYHEKGVLPGYIKSVLDLAQEYEKQHNK